MGGKREGDGSEDIPGTTGAQISGVEGMSEEKNSEDGVSA